MDKSFTYSEVRRRIDAILSDPCDWIAAMATVSCELHAAFPYYNWTGFYRTVRTNHLQVGPYQGGHGCIDIPFSKGVCGAAARTKKTQLVLDVGTFPGHIACSSSTQSEIVVPIFAGDHSVVAVLDVDSDEPNSFDSVDQKHLERLCQMLGEKFGDEAVRLIDIKAE